MMTLDVQDGVGLITLNRPEAMNALSLALKAELAQALREIADSREIRCLVITGTGRAFCAGGDITEMDAGRAPEETRRRFLKLLREIYIPLARLEMPVIAAVNGHAHGSGCSLAMACDIVFAARSAQFSLAFLRVGLIPDSGALFFLPRLVGVRRAKELVFSARRFGDLYGVHCFVELERRAIVSGNRMQNCVPSGSLCISTTREQRVVGINLFDYTLRLIVDDEVLHHYDVAGHGHREIWLSGDD